MQQPETRYQKRLEEVQRELAALQRKTQTVSWARIAVFGFAFALVVAMVWGPLPSSAWWGVGGLVALFAVLVVVHARLFEALATAGVREAFFQQGLLRTSDDWRKTPPPKGAPAPAEHLFADDLDILGEGGLVHMLPAAATPFGRAALRAILLSSGVSLKTVQQRQGMVRELATLHDVREQLHVLVDAGNDDAAERAATWSKTAIPSVKRFAVLAWILPLSTGVLALLAQLGMLPSGPAFASAGLSIVVSMFLAPRLAPYFSALEWELHKIESLFQALETAKFEHPELCAMQAQLRGSAGADGASAALSRLARIASFANARNNEMFRFVLGPVLQWDLHAAVALEGVHASLGGKLAVWLETLGEFDAHCSLGSFAFEHPAFAWPEFSAEPILVSKALAHPLLPAATRKANTLDLSGVWVITGSNMAGKSTLLRAVGVAVVLAYAGAPVCASQFKIGVFTLASSMRIRDSLGDGISRFYAELKKLKAVLAPSGPLLVLLDEILSGTNMRERVLGARGILRSLHDRRALGLVSTHDLELTSLEFVHNAHFEEQVAGDVMSFDYQLREGVVKSGNALMLMKAMGLDFTAESDANL